jgi:hypothetical protein
MTPINPQIHKSTNPIPRGQRRPATPQRRRNPQAIREVDPVTLRSQLPVPYFAVRRWTFEVGRWKFGFTPLALRRRSPQTIPEVDPVTPLFPLAPQGIRRAPRTTP